MNNAGGVNKARRVTVDGIEMTFAVNHLGYFLLTNLLCDRIKESAPARIVTVASIGHRQGKLDFDDHHQAYPPAFIARVVCDPTCHVTIVESVDTRPAGG